MSIKQISTVKDLKNKRIILRLDLNESVDSRGKLLDDFRIQATLPTIKSLVKAGGKLIIISHLGRPEGKVDPKFSLLPIAKSLAEYLDYKFVVTSDKLPSYAVRHLVLFQGDITNSATEAILSQQSDQDIVLLENIRFYPEEENNDTEFSKKLAQLGDVYIDDAFSVAHRAESSNVGITEFMPSYAGPLLAKEISSLDILLSGRYKKPFVLLMGGIKISDKAQTLTNLGKQADKILIGGGLANLFLQAQGYDVDAGSSDKASIQVAKQILLNLKSKIVLPTDVAVLSAQPKHGTQVRLKLLPDIIKTDKVYDIGPQTILNFTKILQGAGTICWNGPMGYFEQKPFRAGTLSMAKVIGGLGQRKAYTVAGGGETVAAIRQSGQFEHFDHVSTGGGAMLEYLAGNKLPAIKALE